MDWFKIALQLRGSVAPTVIPRALLFGIFGFIVSLLAYLGLPVSWNILGNVITNVVFNLVLGLLLVFRTNTAYDRYWEGRKAWGVLVINGCNLARQVRVAIAEVEPTDTDHKNAALRWLSAFAITTKLHLRQEPANSELESLLSPSQYHHIKDVKNRPLKIALWIGDYLQQQHTRNCLSSDQLTSMNLLLDQMVEAVTECERILKTPIPPAYAIYLKRLLIIYCTFLPFQLVEEVKLLTGLVVTLISFVLLGIEEIANEIEDPFGHDSNDLPVDEICTTMLQNIEDLITPSTQESEVSLSPSSLASHP